MSNNALAVYGQFDNLQRAALALYESGYFGDTKSKAQAIVKVMAGAELGIPPFAAMTGINIIQGKPAIGSNLIATLVKNDPRYDYRVKVATSKECILSWFENGEAVGESTFTWKEAETTKQWSSKKNAWEALADKHNYQNYPSDMLFARALTRGARRFAPGIFGGSPVYTADELGADTDEDGNIVEGEMVTEVIQPNEIPLSQRGEYEQHISPGDTPQETPPPAKAKRQRPAAPNGKAADPLAQLKGKAHNLGRKLHTGNWDDKRSEIIADMFSKSSINDLDEGELSELIKELAEALNGQLAD